MKPGRQSVIYDIITQQDIETQHQLLQALKARGINSTQATLSRDVKDMRLIKELGPSGNYRYVLAARPEADDSNLRLKKIFKESVISYAVAQNIFILKTLSGLAPAACAAIDSMEIKDLVGTLAGDDTAFLAMADNEAAQNLYHEIEMLL